MFYCVTSNRVTSTRHEPVYMYPTIRYILLSVPVYDNQIYLVLYCGSNHLNFHGPIFVDWGGLLIYLWGCNFVDASER